MDVSIPYYCKSTDWDALMRDYPPPPFFERTTGRMSADELRHLQETRFLERIKDAWQLRFYRERWTAAGLNPSDIESLDDIDKIPTFNSDDLKVAIANAPPFGTHQIARNEFGRFPLKIQTSGGTTGMPRATLFDTIAWEVQGIQAARAFYAQGARPGDVIQIPFTNSLANAAWCALTGAFNWAGCVPVTSGSGVVTSTERQLEYAKAWGTNAWYAMAEYFARMVEVANEMKFDLHQLPTKFLHAYLGPDVESHLRHKLEEAYGAPVYDNYGTHEVGLIAFECQAQDRMHISEDTVYLQTVTVDDEQALPRGERGNLVATSLHRSCPPMIRYNLKDLMIVFEREECSCGLSTRKLSTFLGRSDEMIKLRGTNVFPRACQTAISKDPRTTGEFLCVVFFVGKDLGKKQEMTVRIERKSREIDAKKLSEDMVVALHRDLGVRVGVEVVEAGELAVHTRLGGEGKVRRLLDLRK